MKGIVLVFACFLVVHLGAQAAPALPASAGQASGEGPQRVSNYWQGDVSSDWDTDSNWSLGHTPLETENVYIVSANPYNPRINDMFYAHAYLLNISPGRTLTVAYGGLIVETNFTVEGTLSLTDNDAVVEVGNDVIIEGTLSVTNMRNPHLRIGGDLGLWSSMFVGWGTIEMQGAAQTISVTTSTAINNLIIHSGSACTFTVSAGSTLTLNGDFTAYGSIASANTTLILKADVYVGNSTTLTQGTFDLQGGTNTTLDVVSPSQLNHLTLTKTGSATVSLERDINIKGNFVINSGYLDGNSNDINLQGNITNNATPTALSSVYMHFVGTANQTIAGDVAFSYMELNKTTAATNDLIILAETDVACTWRYQWTAGEMICNGGSFTAADINNDSIQGTYRVDLGGIISLTQDVNHNANINGSITVISGGTFLIIGGLGYPSLSATYPIHFSGGTVDFRGHGVYINTNSGISGTSGTLRTSGKLSIVTSINTNGVLLEMYGDTDSIFELGASAMNLYGSLRIDKDAGCTVTMDCNINLHGALMLNGGTLHLPEGFNQNYFYGAVDINFGATLLAEVNYSRFYEGLDVNSGGMLYNYGNLKIGEGMSLNVYDQGWLGAYGTSAGRAVIECTSSVEGFYFNVYSGGTISANYVRISNTGTGGLIIHDGAIVDPVYCLHNCQFSLGPTDSANLTVSNSQDINIFNLETTTSTGYAAYNIHKTNDQGSVNVYTYNADPTDELDPYGRVNWFTSAPVPQITSFGPVIGAPLDLMNLEWTYPFPFATFHIYHGSTPYGPWELLGSVEGSMLYRIQGTEYEFFRVTAELPD